ncbi:MAG: DNRLRE domain-containing protein [Chloroflexi bacterium]|nr:DNRLRE domain-containing protein [Chloroflexota bacterium]
MRRCRAHWLSISILLTSFLLIFLFNLHLRTGLSAPGTTVAAERLLLAPIDDTYAFSVEPDANHGAEGTFFIYNADAETIARVFLQFPLDSLPTGAEILSATLSLSLFEFSTAAGKEAVMELIQPGAVWDEETLTWNKQPDIDAGAGQAALILSPFAPGAVDSFDVTDLLRQALARQRSGADGDGKFGLRGRLNAPFDVEHSQEWTSKEGSDDPPQLEVLFTAESGTQTVTASPSPSPSSTHTATPSPSSTRPSPSPTRTVTPSPSPTRTVTPSPSSTRPPSFGEASAGKSAIPASPQGVYAGEDIRYRVDLSWRGDHSAGVTLIDPIPSPTVVFNPGSLAFGDFISCQFVSGSHTIGCNGAFPASLEILRTFMSFTATAQCEMYIDPPPVTVRSPIVNRADVLIDAFIFQPSVSTEKRVPFRLQASSPAFLPSAVIGNAGHTLLFYTILKEEDPDDIFTLCNFDAYLVVDDDLNNPIEMSNDGAGADHDQTRGQSTNADFHPEDQHHSTWFTPREDRNYNFKLFVVETGAPFANALLADEMTLSPRKEPVLAVFTDFRGMFEEFAEIATVYRGNLAMTHIRDRNGNRALDYYDVVARLVQYAANEKHLGVVLDVRQIVTSNDINGYDYYSSFDERNAFGVALDGLVSVLPNSIENISIIGTDRVVPYRRIPVRAKAANETNFANNESRALQNPTIADIANTTASTKGNWLSDIPYGTRADALPSLPRMDMAVARLFYDHALELTQLIDRMEQPLPLDNTQGRAWAVNQVDDSVDFDEMVEEFLQPGLTAHYGSLTSVDVLPRVFTGTYGAGDAFQLDGNRSLISDGANPAVWDNRDISQRVRDESDWLLMMGHGNHQGVTEGGGAAYVTRQDMAGGLFSLLISSGCHNGVYPAFRNANTWRQNWLVNAAFDAQSALFATSSYDVSYEYLGDMWDVFHDQGRRLAVEKLTDAAFATVGAVHRSVNNSYNEGWATEDNDIRTLYTMHLFGLPTQPISLTAPVSPTVGSQALLIPLAGHSAPPEHRATAGDRVITGSFPNFLIEAVEDQAGRVGFLLPVNGGMDTFDFAAPMPFAQHSYLLPADSQNISVTLTFSASHPFGRPIDLMPGGVLEKSFGPQSGETVLPNPYPEVLLAHRVYTEPGGLRLVVQALPVQYNSASREATLFDRLDYRISFRTPSRAASAAPQIVAVDTGASLPVERPQNPVTVTVQTDAPFAGALAWEVRDLLGRLIAQDHTAVQLVPGASLISLNLDSRGWTPGHKQLVVSLRNGTPPGTGLADALTAFFDASGVVLEAALAPRRNPLGPGQVVVSLTTRTANGSRLTGQAASFTQTLNGQPLALSWNESSSGYTATLPLAGLAQGEYALAVYLPGAVVEILYLSVDGEAPVSTLTAPPAVETPLLPVTISAEDLSGIDTFFVDFRVGMSGGWTRWLTRTGSYDFSHSGLDNLNLTFGPDSPLPVQPQTPYCFRVHAVDKVGNREAEHPQPDVCVTYEFRLYLPKTVR